MVVLRVGTSIANTRSIFKESLLYTLQSVDRNVTVGKVIWGKDEKTNVGVACNVCV